MAITLSKMMAAPPGRRTASIAAEKSRSANKAGIVRSNTAPVDSSDTCRTHHIDCSVRSEPSGAALKSCLTVKTLRDSLRDSLCDESDHSLSPPSPRTRSSSVNFGTLEFREYPIILGDNPSASCGPPIGIGWEFDDVLESDIDTYEAYRDGGNDELGGSSSSRRSKSELRIPSEVREFMLVTSGYSRQEIRTATQSARKEKDRRITSIRRQRFDPIVHRVDGAKRGLKRIVSSPSLLYGRRDSVEAVVN